MAPANPAIITGGLISLVSTIFSEPCLFIESHKLVCDTCIGQNFWAYGNWAEGIELVFQKNDHQQKLAIKMTGRINASAFTTLTNLVPVSSTSRKLMATPPKS